MEAPETPWRVVDAPATSAAGGAGARREDSEAPRPPAVAIGAGLVAIVLLALAAVAVGSGWLGGAPGLGSPDASVSPAGSDDGAPSMVVDVGGAVVAPGVYHLPAG